MTRFRLLEGLTSLLGLVTWTVWGMGTTADDRPAVSDQSTSDVAATDDEPTEKDLNHFMRLKLEASSQILEGLAVEDFALIKEGASRLHKMSTEEKWRVTNDAMYRNFSGDFQRITQELVTASEKENLDRAALKWMDATMSCIECHRYTRSITIAADNPIPEVQR